MASLIDVGHSIELVDGGTTVYLPKLDLFVEYKDDESVTFVDSFNNIYSYRWTSLGFISFNFMKAWISTALSNPATNQDVYTTLQGMAVDLGQIRTIEENEYTGFGATNDTLESILVELQDLNISNGSSSTDLSAITINTENSYIELQHINSVIANPARYDAFGRMRVSAPETIFELSHLYDRQTIFVNEFTDLGATITYSQAQAAVSLNVANNPGSKAVRQTKRYFNYQPGKSLLILLTGVLASSNTGGQASIVKRTSISGTQVDVVVNQADWNVDKADGTGECPLLDFTKAQIFWMDLEWLGVGTVRTGVVVNGQFYVLHVFHHANIINSVYMSRASLPIRYEIERTVGGISSKIGFYDDANMKTVDSLGNGIFFQYTNGDTTGTVKQICATVISEGGYNAKGRNFSVDNGITTKSVGVTTVPIISIRPKAAYNRITISPIGAHAMTQSNTSFKYEIRIGGTINPTVWTSVNTESGVEFNLDATTVTGGRVIETGYVSSTSRISFDTLARVDFAGTDIGGTCEVITLCVQSFANNNNVVGGLNWEEIL